jgi:hypothetical protein
VGIYKEHYRVPLLAASQPPRDDGDRRPAA